MFQHKKRVARTVNRQVVRVVVGGAAGHELVRSRSSQIDRVIAEEAVHVARVLAGLYNGVDVFAHDVPRVDQGIRLHRARGGQKESWGEHWEQLMERICTGQGRGKIIPAATNL